MLLLLSEANKAAESVFDDVLGRKDRADATRNALSVLNRFKLLFYLPNTIEKNIEKVLIQFIESVQDTILIPLFIIFIVLYWEFHFTDLFDLFAIIQVSNSVMNMYLFRQEAVLLQKDHTMCYVGGAKTRINLLAVIS